MTSLKYVAIAFAVALAPAVALAQVPSNPAVPGSGYKIPEVHTEQKAIESALDSNLAKPGDGYQAPQVASPTAPKAPATNDEGQLPESHSNHD